MEQLFEREGGNLFDIMAWLPRSEHLIGGGRGGRRLLGVEIRYTKMNIKTEKVLLKLTTFRTIIVDILTYPGK